MERVLIENSLGCTSHRTFCIQDKNVYAPDSRDVYFFSDPPHLIKTARNCLSHSSSSSTSRLMKVI